MSAARTGGAIGGKENIHRADDAAAGGLLH